MYKIGDVIKFDKDDSFFTWTAKIVKVNAKTVTVIYTEDEDDKSAKFERVNKKMIVGIV